MQSEAESGAEQPGFCAGWKTGEDGGWSRAEGGVGEDRSHYRVRGELRSLRPAVYSREPKGFRKGRAGETLT